MSCSAPVLPHSVAMRGIGLPCTARKPQRRAAAQTPIWISKSRSRLIFLRFRLAADFPVKSSAKSIRVGLPSARNYLLSPIRNVKSGPDSPCQASDPISASSQAGRVHTGLAETGLHRVNPALSTLATFGPQPRALRRPSFLVPKHRVAILASFSLTVNL